MQSVQTMSPSLPPSLTGNPPSGGMPDDEAGFASVLGGGTSNQAPIPSTPGPTQTSASGSAAGAGDAPVPSIDNSSFQSAEALQKWAPLVQGLPPDERQAAEKALNRPLAAAQMLKSGTPDQKKAAQAYIDANPALKKALDTAAHGGKADGTISDHDISAFIGNMSKQLDRSDNTVKQYQKNFPNADAQSLQLVRQSALLQANLPISNANSPDEDGKVGDTTTKGGLLAMAQDPGLSSALQGAARTFAQPGMFQLLDQGGKDGVDLATHNADGKFNEDNIIAWVSKQAPTTGGQFASTISDAATRNAVSSVDTSSLNQDVFANPQNYTGAQKAAVLVQLQTTQQQLDAGQSLRKSDDTNTAVQKDIAQLSADPDVQQFLSQAVPQNEKTIVGTDPSMVRAVQTTYQNSVLTGQALQTGLDGVDKNNADKKNTKQFDASAISDFSSQLQLDSDLTDGQAPSAAQIVGGNSALSSRLQNDYASEFSQGGELHQLQGEKDAKLDTSLQTVQGDEQTFESVLNPAFVQSQSGAYSQSLSSAVMADGGSGQAVISALGQGGKASPSDIAATISEAPPAQLYGNGATGLTASDTKSLVSSFLDDLKGGASISDACARFDPGSPGFDPDATDPAVMAKLQSNPVAAQGVQSLLRNVAGGALGLPGTQAQGSAAGGSGAGPGAQAGTGGAAPQAGGAAAATDTTGEPGETAQEKTEEGLMYGGLALGVGSMAAIPANYVNNRRTGATDEAKATTASRIAAASEVAGGIGGALGAATMLPSVSALLKNGQTTEAALNIAGGTRGVVQAGALALNAGDFIARRSGSLGITAGTDAAKAASTRWTGDALGRTAGAVAGRVVGTVAGEATGMAAAEAIGAAAGPIGWAIDAAVGVGFVFELIAQAVKKAHERKEMDHTVDPTLKQYGIPTPH